MSDETHVKPMLPSLRAGGRISGIIPQTFDDVYRLALVAIKAGILKRQSVKNDAGDWVPEDDEAVRARGAMIIMQGMEIDVPPMMALQLMALIGNRIVLHSEGVPGVLWAKGFKIEQWIAGSGDARVAHCKLTRPTGEVIERKFSVDDAKRAKLWSPEATLKKRGKNGSTYEVENDSAWHCYPDRMLPARALGFAAKDGGSDALRGIGIREEVEDTYRMRDVTPTRTVVDIPSIPDPAPDTATLAADDIFEDQENALQKFRDEYAEAGNDVDARSESWTNLAGFYARLTPANQKAADDIFEGRRTAEAAP